VYVVSFHDYLLDIGISSLEISQVQPEIFSNYGVCMINDQKKLVYSLAPNLTLTEDNWDSDEYNCGVSLIDLFRLLILMGGRVYKSEGYYPYIRNLKTSNTSFGINVAEVNPITDMWETALLYRNMPDGSNGYLYDREFMIPKTDLSKYEDYIIRTGTRNIQYTDKELNYDTFKIKNNLPIYGNMPYCMYSISVAGVLQFLCEGYQLVLSFLSPLIFDNTPVRKSEYPSVSKLGTDGYISIKSTMYNPRNILDLYLLECESIATYGESTSVKLRNDPLFSFFYKHSRKIIETTARDPKSKKLLYQVYRDYRTTCSLIQLLLQDWKMNIFYRQPGMLGIFVADGVMNTLIHNYKISIKGGGCGWRITNYYA
jgi:hypothetical protein